MGKKGEGRVKEVLWKNLINIEKYIFFLSFTPTHPRGARTRVYACTRVIGVKEERRGTPRFG